MSRLRGRVPCLVLAGTMLAVIGGLGTTMVRPAGAVSPGTTEVVSVGAEGNDTVGAATSPAISADGRQIAFESRAPLDPAVLPSENPAYNIYVRDRRAPGRTVLISRGLPMTSLTAARGNAAPGKAEAGLEEGGNDDSVHPTLSADGRYVAFESQATNLRDGYFAGGQRIVVCDRDPDGDGLLDEQRPNGTMDYLYLYVGRPPGDSGPTAGTEPTLSADGGVIAWLEQLPSASGSSMVVARFTKDAAGRLTAPEPGTFLRSSLADVAHYSPQLSADGRQVTFATGDCDAALVCLPGSETVEVFEVATKQTRRIDLLPGGEYSGQASRPAISGTGRIVAYQHRLGTSGPVVTVVVDRDPAGGGRFGPAPGVPVSASIASRDTDGVPQEGLTPALSGDGRYLAFASAADKLHSDAQDTGRQAIVLRDLGLDATRERAGSPRLPGELGSPAPASSCESAAGTSCPARGPSGSPRLTADGSIVTFTSDGDDLMPEPCCAGAVFARVLRPRIESTTTDLGPADIGVTIARTVVLRHSGFGPLRVSGLSLSGPDAQDFGRTSLENCIGATLHPLESCSVEVSFTPTTTGRRQATLRVRHPDGSTGELTLVAEGTEALSGEPSEPPATPKPPLPTRPGQLVVTPDPLNFGGTQPALVAIGLRTAQVSNETPVPVLVTAVGVLAGPRFTAGDFAVVRSSCTGLSLAPGATCSVEVGATPQNGGQRTGILAITTADPAYSRLIALRSSAAQPALQVNPGVVRMNRVATVTGQNFPPGRAVTFTLAGPGTRLLVTSVAAPDGTVAAAMVVFPQTSVGTWPVLATVGGTALRAQAPVLIVPGSYQPPGFTSRR